MKKLTKATLHWFNVGLFLKVTYSRLKAIRKENQDVSDCLREMLAAWLNKTYDASPRKMVFALKDSKLVESACEFASEYGENNTFCEMLSDRFCKKNNNFVMVSFSR